MMVRPGWTLSRDTLKLHIKCWHRCLLWHYYALCVVVLSCLVILLSIVNSVLPFQVPLLKTWQMIFHRKLPARVLSKAFGRLTAKPLSPFMRKVILGSYVRFYGCKMDEAVVEDINQYDSVLSLFTRTLKEETRPISADHPLVSPADGTVVYVGRVEDGVVRQVKGVTYSLDSFLGPDVYEDVSATDEEDFETIGDASLKQHRKVPVTEKQSQNGGNLRSFREQLFADLEEDPDSLGSPVPRKGNRLYCVVMYLSPGDYHHFHSPAEWTARLQRHFHGELITVAPWALKALPGLLTLNERVLLSGSWEHGFFSFTAVGAYNVGSIKMDFNKDLQSNVGEKKHYYEDRLLGIIDGLSFQKGQHLGHFEFGSSVVLLFEAPATFDFSISAGSKVQYGQPVGRVHGQAHIESDLE